MTPSGKLWSEISTKDADFIQAVQSGQKVRQSDYGTTGTIYTEKKN
jgi:hypothetical protein